MNIYIAGALFSISEKKFNLEFAEALKSLNDDLLINLPQIQAKEAIGKKDFDKLIFDFCSQSVLTSDAIICILEGSDVDSGTCIELGIAYANNKKIIGIRTDFRGSEIDGLNIMVRRVLTHYIHIPNAEISLNDLAKEVNKFLT